jgi:hypothetical protein
LYFVFLNLFVFCFLFFDVSTQRHPMLAHRSIVFVASALMAATCARAADEASRTASAPISGQRVFTAGHSFHYFMPPILTDIAAGAKIDGHKQVGLQALGGSRVIQHWQLGDTGGKTKNILKPALETGEVDVLTLSPIYLPDEGIDLVAAYALKHNPKIRVLVQEFWLPYDEVAAWKTRPKVVEHDKKTMEVLCAAHAPYFAAMDAHVTELNKKYGKTAVFVVPVGQAVLGLREKIIAGKAPGIKTQSELFTDALGHVHAPIRVLNAYCQYSVIYRRSPVGLPVPKDLSGWKGGDVEALNKLLQEIAWDAAKAHPLSGVEPAAGAR